MNKRNLFAPFLILPLSACSSGQPDDDLGTTRQIEQHTLLNGDFEDGAANAAPPNWQVTPYTFPTGGVTYPPTTRAHLNLQTGGTAATFTWLAAGGPESAVDPSVGTTGSLRWPKYGNKVAVVNYSSSGRNGNSLRQTMTVATSDIDPIDGKAHVRFAIAPVLEDPNHAPNEQPYYFVQLRNLTKATTLYQDFNASAQPGVPWKTVGSTNYTDWQLVDIAPGNVGLAVGDSVELEVIASRCSLSGHFGRVYVDGVGPTVPGLYVTGSGPSGANAGDNITYNLFYSNGGTGTANGVEIQFHVPTNTTWVGLDAPGLTCTAPTVGGTGMASCLVGSVAPGASGNLTMTVNINSGTSAGSVITAGNYQILGTAINPLLGQKVRTNVTTGVTYADLSLTKTNNVGGLAWGQSVAYDIVVENHGPGAVVAAPVTDTLPAQLTGATWTCVGAGGGTCNAANGTGSISTTVSLPLGATATFQVLANVVAGTGSGTLSNTATVAVPGGVTDTNTLNNAAVDTDMIGELQTVSISKYGGAGTVVSTPAAINCGPGCSSATGNFVNGMTITLNAVPAVGEVFLGWGGACSGTSTSCTFAIDENEWVAAIFETVPRDDGQSCSGPHQCTSGFCSDGVCCDAACGNSADDCQSCAIAGSVGTCTVVALGTECAGASCEGGTFTPAAVCDGVSPTCTPSLDTSCNGLACEGNACKSTCVDSTDCVSGYYCEADECHELIDQGEACTQDSQCATGSCVDGVCCNSACTGQCEACNLQAAPGVCLPVSGDPVGGRAACATDGSSCGGTCDGIVRTSCSYPSSATECDEPSCSDGVAVLPALCDGAGGCDEAATQPCAPFVCGSTMCLGDCTLDAHCADGLFCSGGVCEPELTNGSTCSRDAQCESGECVDGVCCDGACEGQCEACDVSGSLGTCSPVVGDPRGDRASCASDGSLCGGACDGLLTTACTYPSDVSCRDASCANGEATLAASCDGAGSCPAVQTQACGDFACGVVECEGDCTTDAQCAEGSYCSAGVCTTKLASGETCAAENQCASGSCVDGVCCDSACTGQCEACDVPGTVGTCSPVLGAPHGARAACSSDGSLCGGACNGSDREQCAFPSEETSCRAAVCAEGIATLGASCDGQGHCPDLMEQDCGTFECGATSCLGDCDGDADCSVGSFCSAGVCVVQFEDGDACSKPTQCESGNCVDGVCCNTSCEGQCAACDLPGTEGTCSAVTGQPRNGRAACLGEGPCGGVCDGVEMAGCAFPGSEVTCREASCSEGFATESAVCGSGLCQAATVTSCGPYACRGDECATACETAADCSDGNRCVDEACVAPCATSEQCGAGERCDSGTCVAEPEEEPKSRGGIVQGGGFGCSMSRGGVPGAPLELFAGLALSGLVLLRRRDNRDNRTRVA